MSKRKDQDGAAVVEFALIFPIFVLIVMGIIQFGWYFFNAEATNSAAREVARRVVVGDCWAGGRDAMARGLSPQMTGSVTVSPSPSSLHVGDKVTITVTSDSELVNFVPGIPATVTREYVARMEVDTQSIAARDACLS